ncbi:MAG: thioesterase [Desulfobacterales bacterium]|nr:MAG: thioesterase [Desulfobacterales bacterium]
MAYSHEITLQVPFHDLDPMRIVWHGHYFKYFDRARLALFDNAGIDLYQYMTQRQIAFPITRTQTKHIAPLLPRDQFVCKATVTEARFKIAMEFEIRRLPNRQLCVP